MEFRYHGLIVSLSIEGITGIDSFKMTAAFNTHAMLELRLLMDEERVEENIHAVKDGDSIMVYSGGERKCLFAGKIMSSEMYLDQSLRCMKVQAVSYTAEWELAVVSRSYTNLDATYRQVMDRVLEDQPDAEIMDCVTDGAVIPDFLLQYEESDWDFLMRLASHFNTFLVPDCRADHGRVYFGLPDLGEACVPDCEEYREFRNMETYYRLGESMGILPQEYMRWELKLPYDLCLGQKARFQGIVMVVTGFCYQIVDGELVRQYELGREKGIFCVQKKNPDIFGMSLPATVRERKGNCVRVQFDIDPSYEDAPNNKYFTYAIESSFIYCMPEVGSRVHIYFPGDDEKAAVAVHAIRSGAGSGLGTGGYAQLPDHKSFSNVNGAELMLSPEMSYIEADQSGMVRVSLEPCGKADIKGNKVEINALINLSVGEGSDEGGSAGRVSMTAGSIAFQAGENGSQVLMAGELRIIATFVKLEATDTSPADNPYSLDEVISQVTANDEAMRDSVNAEAADELVANYEEGRSKVLNGLVKFVTTAVVTGIAIATGGAAVVVAAAVLGTASMLMTEAEIFEGIDQAENAQSGSLDKGYNAIRDGLLDGNDLTYNILRGAIDIAFGIVTGAAVGEFIGSLKGVQWLGNIIENPQTLKTVLQVTQNIGSVALRQYIDTGRLDFDALAAVGFTGFIQGQYGTSIRNWFVGKLGVSGCNFGTKLITGITGTLVDTGIEGGMFNLFGQEFNPVESLARNGFANFLEAFTHDPVSVTTGAFILHATDAVIMSLPLSLKIGRLYRSTDKKDSVFGRGFSFAYASRLYRDTKKEKECVHLETITGHSVCFEKEDGAWVNVSRGTGRFTLESRMEGIQTEEQAYLLNDAIEHTVCAYDSTGRLSCVEYPNSLRLVFTYGAEGLKRIATPLGNILEVECGGGHILQITDEIGRRTQYRYEGSYLVDVIHTDEGITHYEYDEYGYISSVTDQNGSRYLENTYDEKGRVVRQDFPDGVYQTFAYDSLHRRNTIYCSDSDRTEVYEYNDQMLIDRILYEDGTETAYGYSDDNLRNRETSRTGLVKTWEHDACGRIVREGHPDGYEAYSEYDVNDDLIHTWDSDGRECRYVYDNSHNRLTAQEKITDGQWKETSWEYDAKGRCTKETDALGNETVKEYTEDCAYPVSVITPEGEETDNSYDRMGRRMSISNPYGTVELSYNSRNFVTKRTDGEGHTSCRLYDRMGNMTVYYPARQWEEQGDGWQYSYDYMERLVDTVSPSGTHRRSFVNFVGDPVRSIHPVSYALNGEVGEGTRYEYDRNGNLTHIRYADGGVERRFYDADGRMVKQVLPESYDETTDDGEGTCYAYDGMDRITEVRDTDGNTLHTYVYNGNGQIIREKDGEGKETLYAYNGLGLLTRKQESIRKEGDRIYYRVTAYGYDSRGNKTEEAYGQQEAEKDGEPESWHKILFSYDKNNRLILVTDGTGAKVRYAYDCLGNRTLKESIIEEGIVSRIHYLYDKNGKLKEKREEIEGNGDNNLAVTLYGRDADGNINYVKTPGGAEIYRDYDVDGRLEEERIEDKKNGICRTERYSYDEAGNIINRKILGTDGESLEDKIKYDLKDRVTHRSNAAGAVMRFIYDKNDRLIKKISPYGYNADTDEGTGSIYDYDSRGNRIRVTNGLGEAVQEAVYDLNGNISKIRDADGNRTELSYDMDGQMIEARREDAPGRGQRSGQRILRQQRYNAMGQTVGITDGNGVQTAYDKDAWGNTTGVSYSDDVKEGYEYNFAGLAAKTTDGNGNSVQYRYNSMGKVRERIDQLGEKETFLYDGEGNLILHTDRDGRQLRRAYNVFGRPVYEKATDRDGEHACISTWQYDSIGRIIRAACGGHSYEYSYDEYGRLQEKRSHGKRLVSYAYDAAGNVTEITDPAGVRTCYEYDILGRKSRIYGDHGLEVRYVYDSMDRLKGIHYANGVETKYAYDADGNLEKLETKAGEKTLLSFTYQYDGNGNRTAKAGMQRMAAGAENMDAGSCALDISYCYDIRGRLLEEKRNGESTHYAYDRAGNRTEKKDSKGKILYFYNEKNQLTCVKDAKKYEKKDFSYDHQGGIIEEKTKDSVRRFIYNSRHQQIRVERQDGSGQTLRVQENSYDAEGLRFELAEDGRHTRFVYHDSELLYEEGGDKQDCQYQTSYHLGAGIDAAQRGKELSYYHRDEQLSTAFLTGSNGDVRNSYLYDAFGMGLEEQEQFPNRIRYTGQQYDGLTGQYYLRARYYNPVYGRFMQEDVYQGDGLNLYAYCHNNPVVYYDPSGYDLASLLDVLAALGEDMDSVEYWEQGRHSSYSERLRQTPAGQHGNRSINNLIGSWEGSRGESLYVADNYSDAAVRANEVISQYGQRGIYYSNAEANFRPVSEITITIENMNSRRYGSTSNPGNFDQADEALANYLNAHPECDLYQRFDTDGIITSDDVYDYRKANELTWHEENDMVHMDLVSEDVNSVYGHLGGTAEAKREETGQEYRQEGCSR